MKILQPNLKVFMAATLFSASSSLLAHVPAWTEHGLEYADTVNELGGMERSSKSLSLVKSREVVGDLATLVLMVSFNDRTFETTKADWNERFFEGEKSVAEYFHWTSGGEFNLSDEGAGVMSIELDSSHPNTGESFSGAKDLAADAIRVASEQFDFARFDKDDNGRVDSYELAVIMVVAGFDKAYGGSLASEPNIWAHQSSTSVLIQGKRMGEYAMFGEMHEGRQASIGIIAHELGHLIFNLPDLYDRDGSSSGVGNWGLMGRGVWNSQWGQLGDSPAGMLAWSKIQAGFVLPDLVASSASLDVPEGGAVKIPVTSSQYFLVENRVRSSFDTGLPGEGLLVTHIDESRAHNDDENHKLVDIESADGQNEMDSFSNSGDAGDVFPGLLSQIEFGANTVPSSELYNGLPSGVEIQFSPGLSEVDISFSQGDLAASRESEAVERESEGASSSAPAGGAFGSVWLLIGFGLLWWFRR